MRRRKQSMVFVQAARAAGEFTATMSNDLSLGRALLDGSPAPIGSPMNAHRVDRRGLLLACLAPALGVVTARGQQQPARLETLTDWLKASPDARRRGLQSCLDRIRALDSSIRAWVQVAPQPSTGRGTLAGIPYGVKDIIETRGVATEYGAPSYKGRLGTGDAASGRETE